MAIGLPEISVSASIAGDEEACLSILNKDPSDYEKHKRSHLANEEYTYQESFGPTTDALVEMCGDSDSVCKVCIGFSRDLAVFSLASKCWDGKRYIKWRFSLSDLADAMEKRCQFCGLIAVSLFSNVVKDQLGYHRQTPLGGCCRKADTLGESAVRVLEMLRQYTEKFPGAWFAFAVRPKDYDTETGKYGRLQFNMAETNVDQHTGFLGARETFASEMYARPGDVAAKYLKYRPVDTTPNSDQSVLEVQGWVQDCIDNHTECPKPKLGELPTRLIEIEDENDLKIVTGVRDGAYAALSYCWGGPQLFALKRENKDKMMNRFKKSDLPLTIQHGITLARKLGLRYIWIDSLCIIQNDDGDKTKELPKMISNYRNAYITIASGSSTCYDGFLDRRGCKTHESDDLPPDLLEMRVFYPMGEEEELGDSEAMFTMELPSGPCVLKESKIMIREEAPYMMSSEPISERGWTFQERVLSPRLVLYGQRTTWTCQTKQYSAGGAEDWGRDERSLDISMLALELKSSGVDDTEILDFGDFKYGFRYINYGKGAESTKTKSVLPDTWHRAVKEYSCRQLSEPKDKLPAISEIAAAVQKLTSARYVAGLWEESLLRDLLWCTYPCIVTERPAVWRAPTWSWASCDKRVKFKHISESTSVATARAHKCPVTRKSSSALLGEVIEEGTELILTTALMPAVSPEIIQSIVIDEDRMDPSTIGVDHASRQRLYEMAKSHGASLAAEDWEVPEYCQLAVLFVELKDVPTELQEGHSEDLAASSSDDDRPLVVICTLPGDGGRPSDILVMNEGTLNEMTDDPFLTSSFDREDRKWKVKRDIIMTGLVIAPTPERKWHRLGAFTKTIKGWDKPFFFPWKTIALV